MGQYGILYQTVGGTPVPLVLTILALKPDKVVFLVTEESRKQLDIIIEYTGLKPSQFESRTIRSISMVDIYEEIKKDATDGSIENGAVDITGGKKVMAGGAALAGAYLDIDILYIENPVSHSIKKHRLMPGEEILIRIDNPFRVLGDRELQRARALLKRFDFAGAVEILGRAARVVKDPQVFQLYFHLANGYRCWDDFDFSRSERELRSAIDAIEQFRLHREWRTHLKQQLQILGLLQGVHNKEPLSLYRDKATAWALVGSCYANAGRRAEQNRFDFAVLLLYRVLEMLSQMRLAAWGLDSRAPVYDKLGVPTAELTARFKAIQRDLYKEDYRERDLPQEIALMQGLALLKALDDPWAASLDLEQVKNSIDRRNSSILAHGISLITRKGHEEMHKLVRGALEKAWEIWPGAEMSFDEYMTQFECLSP